MHVQVLNSSSLLLHVQWTAAHLPIRYGRELTKLILEKYYQALLSVNLCQCFVTCSS